MSVSDEQQLFSFWRSAVIPVHTKPRNPGPSCHFHAAADRNVRAPMPKWMSKGVLLVNLGSPDSPSVADVRRYLREFLMDGRVLDTPWPVRFCVVHFAILPSRPRHSA